MNPPNDRWSPCRKRSVTFLAGTLAFIVGIAMGWPAPALPVMAFGACQSTHASCGVGDDTKTSVLEVNHATVANPADPVLPDDSESWEIHAWWAAAGSGICADVSETATATVTWTGSGWSLSNVNLTQDIVDIQLCDAGSCAGTPYGASPSRRYRLKVDINDPDTGGLNLREVIYTTTSVDDGVVVTNSNCATGSTVTPTSQTFTQTDSGAFECSYDCTNIAGPLVTITYN